MFWVPVAAWGAALVLAAVVLGLFAYDIRWKAKRLNSDLDTLHALGAELRQLQDDLAAVQDRAAVIQRSTSSGTR